MKSKQLWFYIICGALIASTITFFLNMWYKFIPSSYIDEYVLLMYFTIIGLSLLPFADKLKIGSFLEIERLKEKIEEVQLHQYLGEIVLTPNGGLEYYDADGIHKVPDQSTHAFLVTSKGYVAVPPSIYSLMKSSYPIDSVLTSEKITWNGKHVYVLLNGKKYWVGPNELADVGIPGGDVASLRMLDDIEITKYPTGKK